eukprot:RCo013002
MTNLPEQYSRDHLLRRCSTQPLCEFLHGVAYVRGWWGAKDRAKARALMAHAALSYDVARHILVLWLSDDEFSEQWGPPTHTQGSVETGASVESASESSRRSSPVPSSSSSSSLMPPGPVGFPAGGSSSSSSPAPVFRGIAVETDHQTG